MIFCRREENPRPPKCSLSLSALPISQFKTLSSFAFLPFHFALFSCCYPVPPLLLLSSTLRSPFLTSYFSFFFFDPLCGSSLVSSPAVLFFLLCFWSPLLSLLSLFSPGPRFFLGCCLLLCTVFFLLFQFVVI